MHDAYAQRMSTSAIPEPVSAEFNLGANEYTTRHSIVSFEPSAKTNDGRLAYDVFPPREGNFSDVSGMEALNFWTDDHESSQTSNIITPRTMISHDPYQDICIEVNNHSLSNQGVVLYHVDIKGPEGMLSTYTIRRRYRAFKNLYEEMNRLMTNYANLAAGTSPVSGLESSASVPLSPHSQSQLRHQQTFTRVTLPALPSAGVWTYLKRHDIRLVDQRKKRFQEILSIVIRHPATRNSPVLDSFLSVAPSEISQRGSSYVSLHEYSVPVFDRERESIERKQRKRRVLEGRRMRTDSESNRGFP